MALYLGKKKITPIKVVDLPDDLNTELTEQETLLAELESKVDEYTTFTFTLKKSDYYIEPEKNI